MNNKAIISTTTLKNIANKFRELTNTTDNISMSDLPNKLINISNSENIVDEKHGDWIRPVEFPNLDSIDISEINNLFLATYDNRSRKGFVSIKISLKTSAKVTAQLGYIDNDEFVSIDTIYSTTGTTVYIQKTLNDYDYDYLVLKIVFDENIGFFGMTEYTINSVKMAARDQPVLEIIAKGLNTSSYTTQQAPLGGYFTKKVKLIGFKNCTSFNTMFSGCYNLEEVEFVDFDFSKVSVITSMFQNCISLRNIKGFLDADLPECTGVTSVFSNCNSLTDLTLKFKFYKLDSTKLNFFSGSSLSKLERINFWLDLSECDTLTEIPVSSFGLNSRNVQVLDFSEANFGNKGVNLSTAFQSMYELKKVDLSGINLDNITKINSTFNSCKKLIEIVCDFDFTNSAVTSLNMTFNGCYSLRNIELKGLSKITDMTSLLNGCYSLKTVKFSGISSSLTVLNMKDLLSVNSIIFDNCDLSGLTTNTMNYIFGISTASNSCAGLHFIKINIPLIDLSSQKLLDKNDIINIFNNLDEIIESRTIKLPLYCSVLLNDEDKQIATDKGWSVSF